MNVRNARRSEDTEQISVIYWAQANVIEHPELKWLYHIPNGGRRDSKEAIKLKQMGVKSGVSDLCLPYPRGKYHGLYIEMKYGKNRQTPEQADFLAEMAAVGHYVATCYSAEDAIRVIEQYLELDVYNLDYMYDGAGNADMPAGNNSIMKDGAVVIKGSRRKDA